MLQEIRLQLAFKAKVSEHLSWCAFSYGFTC